MAEPVAEQIGRIRAALERLLAVSTQRRSESAAGALSAEGAREFLADLRNARARMAAIPRTAWLANQATALWNYQGTIGTDFTAIETALNATGNWIATRESQIWTGYAIDDATWIETIPVFTVGATAGLRTEIDALIAALNTFLGRIQ